LTDQGTRPQEVLTMRAAASISLTFGLLMLSLTLVACSSSSDPDDDDSRAPAPISDLAVADFAATSVTLTWTAPGDDGNQGTAARYEVRRSFVFIHPGTWGDAVVIPSPPVPGPAGTVETMTIAGLEQGERYFFAVTAFDEVGNSPGCSNCVEATCYDNTEVAFADPALEAAVRAVLGLPTEPLLRSLVRQIHELQVEGQGVADLGGLEECLGLGFLKLRSNAIVDLSPLAGLAALFDVDLRENEITDVVALAGLTNLRHLHLDDNAIADLTPLAGLANLEILNLARNQIANIAPLAGLVALVSLRLDGNAVADLDPLAAMALLESLSLQQNAVTSLLPLADLAALQVLLVNGNHLTGLDGLTNLGALTLLVATGNLITDLHPLVDNAEFAAGDILYVQNNPLSEQALTVQIPALEARGVAVYY
jgi:hypothetical protein